MIKFISTKPNGARLIGLGLSEENVRRLKTGDMMNFELDDFGLEGLEVLVFYGNTEQEMTDDMRKRGMLPPEKK